ncbi:MBL fold metallo-hydrolase [Nocardia pseudobrasiliensis]|uniref:Glyoxylase-like metal-dependent hydrolase (Beta-lactamase superfamily II) n=1 Tax=Nocardia pseudobrasiliensis TaxID=45979 RepID=A0A370I5L2_9NOCA|nr:MBL fold metallo-hydrolase [Nocardia pseudobrasiliensis]RDI66002.1 glyoxylase-like metal-dependent hydrolase (beta-lactamase superfamily II) [Nocardia pseudobrasiliensis]
MSLTHPAYEQVRPVTASASVLLANNPNQMTLQGTNTWLLRAPDRSEYVVVDPGPKDKAHSEAIARATGGAIALTLITHHHHDHTGGIERLVKLTGTPVRSHDPKFLHGSDAPLTDGEVIEAAGLRITVLATPGHTQDSVSFVLDSAGATGPEAAVRVTTQGPADAVSDAALLTGDTVLGSGTTVLESRDGALGDYLASLDRLAAVASNRALLPAHGPDHPEAKPVIDYYVRHRQERLEQVREALRVLGPNARSLQIVARVYADVDKRLWPAARSSVKAQLAYLRSRSAD